MWMVRAGKGGEKVDEFLQDGVVAFNEPDVGKVPPGMTKDALLKIYAVHHSGQKPGTRASWASQLLRLVTEVKVGDDVVTFDRDRRLYIVGKVSGDYRFVSTPGKTSQARPVTWSSEVPRESLSVAARNSLGSILTVFRVSAEAAAELLAAARPLGSAPVASPPRPVPAVAEQDGYAQISADVEERANELIEDLIDELDWEDVQDLVAGVLRAMGYRTTVAPRGPDRGIDIFASRDGLGLEEPRIFVEVKHRTAMMGSKEVRAFLGGRRKGDRCLYVSTGGFTKDANYEAERSEIPLQLVTLSKLRELVVDYYDKLDPEARALVPLRRVYLPVPRENK